jgi:hypothetical protein
MESSYSSLVHDNLEENPQFVEDANAELVLNGGMESWNSPGDLAYWQERDDGDSTITRNTQEAYKGNACVRLTVDSSNSQLILTQEGIQVEPDTEYYLCFKYRNTKLDLYGYDYGFRVMNNADDHFLNERGNWSSSAQTIKIRNCTGRNGGYLAGHGILFRTPSNASTIDIQFGNLSAPSSSFYLDEVSLRRVPDFQTLPESGMIEAGTFLTYTSSSGTGSSISVEDATCFTDGYGIVDGDTIMLERDGNRAKILQVDYDNNILTVDTNLEWESGVGVTLVRSGYYPDIGIYEHDFGGKKAKVRR